MASTIYDTLKNIELGRQNCIRNAKQAGLNPTQNMTVYDLGNLFLQQNNTETLNPNNPAQNGGWHRPSDWPDTKSILEEATARDGLSPAYIILLDDIDDTTLLSKSTTNMATRGDGFLTSDGAWYTINTTHTWDRTQDIACSEGYKTRWVLVYTSTPTNVSNINLSEFPCLEVIFGNITIGSASPVFGNSSTQNANKKIKSIEILNGCIWATISDGSAFQYCSSLANISLPSVTTINGNSTFQNCYSLTNISLPSVTAISGSSTFQYCYSLTNISLPSVTTISGGNTFQNCYSLTNISLPSVTTISGGSTFSGCFSLTNISLTNLVTCNTGSLFQYCYSLTNISLPSVTTINGNSTFQNCSSLTNISLPSVTAISGSSTFSGCYSLINISLPSVTTISGGSTFSGCFSLTNISLTNLVTCNTGSLFQYCYNLSTIVLANNWSFSGLNVSYSNIYKDVLLDMIDKLADVSSSGNTYTLIIGATNLAKLNSSQIAIATNKGWTVS